MRGYQSNSARWIEQGSSPSVSFNRLENRRLDAVFVTKGTSGLGTCGILCATAACRRLTGRNARAILFQGIAPLTARGKVPCGE
jgi:hypothetical protein